ncbi:MAG: hypothetical protein M1492_02660 [Gammaproteobacteria bacterium]|nr:MULTISPECIES: hypothetical protein [Acidithiobacillus]MCL4525396.1 hypothetical protein [Gammaproteobacteria bacterium]MBU2817919.1 hypothetical protein [Acidithiobacillus ferrooxidans]MBU2861389.1 hypothetical protein [Acidithiobacillus ferrooxidans]MCR1344651.1 hypothetical protein [Acidithiobacillus ferrooxidans]MCR1356568.1 hypothetical protein [Acidithiobacillus ferrooxidans]
MAMPQAEAVEGEIEHPVAQGAGIGVDGLGLQALTTPRHGGDEGAE